MELPRLVSSGMTLEYRDCLNLGSLSLSSSTLITTVDVLLRVGLPLSLAWIVRL